MSRTPPVVLALLLAGAAIVGGCAAGTFRAGISQQYGAAPAPPTADRGTTGMLTYSEQGGPLVTGALFVLASLGAVDPDKDVRVLSSRSSTTKSGDTITTTTVTETSTTYTSPEERERRIQQNEALVGGVRKGGAPFELNLAIASPKFGGNTSGSIAEILVLLNLTDRLEVAIGIGSHELVFAARSVRDLMDDGAGNLALVESIRDVDYRFVGHPVRVSYRLRDHASVFVRWDINYLTMTNNRPSPLTAGVELLLLIPKIRKGVSIKGTVMNDGVDPRRTSVGAEASLVF